MDKVVDIALHRFSVLTFLVVVAAGVAIYVLLYLLSRYTFVFVRSEQWQDRMKQQWAKVELVVWVLYALGAIIVMLNRSMTVTLIILTLVVLLGWRYWRDVVAGLTLRLENRIIKGDYLIGSDYSGVVERVGTRGITLKTDSGEIAFIPFRKLDEFKIRKMELEGKGEMTSLSLILKPGIHADKAVSEVRKSILVVPYILLTMPPHIEVTGIGSGGVEVRAVLYTKNRDDAKIAEMALKEVLRQRKLLAEGS